MKYFRISEIIYLVIAVISFIKVFTEWEPNRNKAYLFLVFGIFSTGMFFFRRHYRKKFNQRKNNDQ